ncbi:MAG: alanine racemase [Verrucomicrobiae bacterium]
MTRFIVPSTLRTWAEVDLAALRHNLALVRRTIGPCPQILAVVKANAYGHGDGPAARALAGDAACFGVATLSEARSVLAAGTGRDIMLLSPCLPAERKSAVEEGVIATVSSAEEAIGFAACGSARVNFKVDTGMGRVGALSEQAERELRLMAGKVLIHSISTHLPSSDADEKFTRSQLEGFSRMLDGFRRLAPEAKIHALNSAGILRFPEFAEDLVRAGLILYGSSPLPELQGECRPALAWKARVTLVKDLPAGAGVSYGRTFLAPRPIRTAVLAVGYADGFPRQASGQGACVLIRGRRCPVLGRVTMDQVVVQVEGDVEAGEEAVLIGTQGNETLLAGELAARANTIAWDIFTGIKGRVVRIYPELPGTMASTPGGA